MPIQLLRNKKPEQVKAEVDGFDKRYVKDWDDWLAAKADARPELFGQILRKWQAFRPHAMRRLKAEAKHEKPFLDDILRDAEEPLRVLSELNVLTIAKRTPA